MSIPSVTAKRKPNQLTGASRVRLYRNFISVTLPHRNGRRQLNRIHLRVGHADGLHVPRLNGKPLTPRTGKTRWRVTEQQYRDSSVAYGLLVKLCQEELGGSKEHTSQEILKFLNIGLRSVMSKIYLIHIFITTKLTATRQIKIINRPILITIFMIGKAFAIKRNSINRQLWEVKWSKSKERKFTWDKEVHTRVR